MNPCMYIYMCTYLHVLSKLVWYTGLGVDDFVHERLSETRIVQFIVAPGKDRIEHD